LCDILLWCNEFQFCIKEWTVITKDS
jgi:hypothetical protein